MFVRFIGYLCVAAFHSAFDFLSARGPLQGADEPRVSLDALDAVPVQGTDGATSPFISPDGSRTGFINLNPFAIRLLSPDGGGSTLVVEDSISGGGASWGDDGYIYFDALTALSRIRPDGSEREVVYALDTLHREVGVAWPEALPGGVGVLFRVRRVGDAVGDFRIMVADLRTRRAKYLVLCVSGAVCAQRARAVRDRRRIPDGIPL